MADLFEPTAFPETSIRGPIEEVRAGRRIPRIVLASTLTSLVALLVTLLAVLAVERDAFRDRAEQETSALTQLVADGVLAGELTARDFAGSRSGARTVALDGLFGTRILRHGVVLDRLIDRHGRVVYSSDHSEVGRAAGRHATLDRPNHRVTHWRRPGGGPQLEVLESLVPVRIGGRQVGSLELFQDYRPVAGAIRRQILALTGLLLLALLAIYAAFLPVLRRVTRATDITERKRAEEELRAAETTYRTLVEQLPLVTYVSSLDDRLTPQYISPQIESLLGHSVAEWASRPFFLEAVHPDDRELVLAEVARTDETGEPFRLEYRFLAADGRVVWMLDESVIVHDDEGQPLCRQGFLVDVTAEKQAEQALRQSEARLQLLLEQLPTVIWTTDTELRLTSAAGASLTALSRGASDLVGINMADSLSADDPIVVTHRGALLGKTGTYQTETAGRTLDVSVKPLTDAAGAIVGAIGAAHDVTERTRAEEDLRETNRTMSTLIDASPLAIAVLDAAGNLTLWNPAAERMFGWAADDVLAEPPPFLLEEQWDEFEGLREAALDGKVVTGVETRLGRQDGSPVDVSVSIAPLLGRGSEVAGAMAMIADVSERRRAAEEVRRSKEFSERLIQSSVSGILAFDRECRYTIWNQAMERILGVKADDVLGRRAVDVFPFLRETGEDKFFLETLNGLSIIATDRPFRVPERGREGFFEASYSPLHDEAGRIVGGLATVRDITEQKELANQFRQSQKMEAVGRLAGGMAHDFNNLLTAINGYSEFLLGSLEEDDPLRRDVEEIGKAGERAAALTRQLLAFSRRQVLQPKVLDLNEVVGDLEHMLRRLIGPDVELAIATDAELGAVRADPGQVEQVLVNLVVNARDAMPQGGRVTIETANVELDAAYTEHHAVVETGPYVLLAVSDTGTGMDIETQAHLFEPFYTTKEQGKGTGLGLSTVYGIVKQSGGYIWVYSERGKGTTLKIYLPRTAERPPRELLQAEPEGRARGSETVLLLEDEDAVRKLACEVLERSGYTVFQASLGEEALELADDAERPIDLLLTDVVMPGMGGREVAERLSASRPGLKVLYMSGYTDEAVVHHGRLPHGVAFLQKPFTPAVLARNVREALDGGPAEPAREPEAVV